jgi:tripartite-type tricarboxylate transporter receptor subunit TctC
MSMNRTFRLGAAGLACLATLAAPGLAQAAWPERAVTLVTPFAAGGITDILARLTAERLAKKFGQPFIVEATPGAAGSLAAQRVLKADPDGHTLFFATLSQIAILPYTNTISFDPQKDFKPISIIATSPFVLASGKQVGAKDLAGFVAEVKANPGKYPYGSAGTGNLTQLSAALFLKYAGLQMNHVPYRGIAPAFQDMLAGHVGMVSASPVEVKPYIGVNDITFLAVTSPKRSAAFPNVPAVAETIPMPPVFTWNGLLAPAAAPPAVIDALSQEIMTAERDPAFLAQLEKLGVDPIVHTPAEFAAMNVADAERWRTIIAELGIKQQQAQ